MRQAIIDLQQPDLSIRKSASAFISRHPTQHPAPMIAAALAAETDDTARSWQLLSLGLLKYGPALPIVEGLARRAVPVRGDDARWATVALNMIGADNDRDEALRLIGSADPDSAYHGITMGFHIKEKSELHIALLTNNLSMRSDDEIRRWSLMSLARTENFDRPDIFISLLTSDSDPIIREWAAWALSLRCMRQAVPVLRRQLEIEGHPRVREWTVKSIYDLSGNTTSAKDVLIDVLKSESDPLVREGAASRLVSGPDDATARELRELLWNLISRQERMEPPERLLFSQLLRMYHGYPMQSDDLALVELGLQAEHLGRREKSLLINATFAQFDFSEREKLAQIRQSHNTIFAFVFDQMADLGEQLLELGEGIDTIMPNWIISEVKQGVDGARGGSVWQLAQLVGGAEREASIVQIVQNGDIAGGVTQSVEGSASSVVQIGERIAVGGSFKQTIKK